MRVHDAYDVKYPNSDQYTVRAQTAGVKNMTSAATTTVNYYDSIITGSTIVE